MCPPHCSLGAGDSSSYPSLHGTLLIYLSFAPFQSHLHRLHPKPVYYPPLNFWCLQGDHLWSFPLLRSSPPLDRLIYLFDSEPRLRLMYPKSVSRETSLEPQGDTLHCLLGISPWNSHKHIKCKISIFELIFPPLPSPTCKPALPPLNLSSLQWGARVMIHRHIPDSYPQSLTDCWLIPASKCSLSPSPFLLTQDPPILCLNFCNNLLASSHSVLLTLQPFISLPYTCDHNTSHAMVPDRLNI